MANPRALLAFSFIVLSTCANLAHADKIYWTVNWPSNHRIERSNLDGTDVEVYPVEVAGPWSLAVDPVHRKLYWTDDSNGPLGLGVFRADLSDGASLELLVPVPRDGSLRGMALDLTHGKMYWIEYEPGPGGGIVRRANLDGTDAMDLVRDLGLPHDIALDVPARKMYWTDFDRGVIQRANLDGTGVETIIDEGAIEPVAIALDLVQRKLYWSDFGRGVSRSNLSDGTDIEDLFEAGDIAGTPWGISLDVERGHLYGVNGEVFRSDLDGSNIQVIQFFINAVPGIALDLGPPPPIPAVSTWGVVVLLLLVLTTGTIAFRNSFRSAA